MQPHIYFRVDGNEKIATGHVMRCLSIAKQVQASGGRAYFICADENPRSLIEAQGFPCDSLTGSWENMEEELPRLLQYIQRQQADVLFIDSYYVTEKYLKTVSEHVKVVYLDDLNQFIYPAHMVINYGAWSENLYDTEAYRRNGLETKFLLGAAYIPLREEFQNVAYEVKPDVCRVLMTTGGTDQLHVARRLLEAISQERELKDLEYHVIAGCFNQDKDALHKLVEAWPKLCMHENVTDMARQMQRCDVAISAAGTTLYELAACGVPAICLEVADNQRGAIRWQQADCMLYAGNMAENAEDCIDLCLTHLKRCREDYALRLRMSRNMRQVVDGKGARRIAEAILHAE